MSMRDDSVRLLRNEVFSRDWPLDEDLSAIAEKFPSHDFLVNPASQCIYIYLTRFVKVLSEKHFGRPFGDLSALDWGCGKGHASKLLRDLGLKGLTSCDLLSNEDHSAFGQETPIIEQFGIHVDPLEHEFVLPYRDESFDVFLSLGVLEHVPNDRASIAEIARVLKPGGLFFCFFLPAELSWTQKLNTWRGGDHYRHDRLYNESTVKGLVKEAGMELIDLWYRQLLPKNSVRYPNFRLFEKMDQLVTEHTPLRYFATNIEFVSVKPTSNSPGAAQE